MEDRRIGERSRGEVERFQLYEPQNSKYIQFIRLSSTP
jgi:hypothetical protein